jgi:uncharacterized tellurite resistance protein B-like protein
MHEKEKAVIREYLGGLASESEMKALDERIESFSMDTFNFESVVATFVGDSGDDKHKLIQVLAAVHTADDEHDLGEDEYLRKVASSLALDAADLRELVLDYQVETLKDHLAKLRTPPPIPSDA